MYFLLVFFHCMALTMLFDQIELLCVLVLVLIRDLMLALRLLCE